MNGYIQNAMGIQYFFWSEKNTEQILLIHNGQKKKEFVPKIKIKIWKNEIKHLGILNWPADNTVASAIKDEQLKQQLSPVLTEQKKKAV